MSSSAGVRQFDGFSLVRICLDTLGAVCGFAGLRGGCLRTLTHPKTTTATTRTMIPDILAMIVTIVVVDVVPFTLKVLIAVEPLKPSIVWSCAKVTHDGMICFYERDDFRIV